MEKFSLCYALARLPGAHWTVVVKFHQRNFVDCESLE